LTNTEPSPEIGRRYEVVVRHSSGVVDAVTVWEHGSPQAINKVKEWLRVVHDEPAEGATFKARAIGSEPDPGDLGVAVSADAVEHRRFSAAGEPIHTRFRVDPDFVRRLTRMMRLTSVGGWPVVRTLLQARDVSPQAAAVVDAWHTAEGSLTYAMVVTADRQVFAFWAGDHPRVSPGGSIEIVSGPALEAMPDRRLSEENVGTLIDAGVGILQEGL
jgi:hypothetical protein